MGYGEGRQEVEAWSLGEVVFESYRYAPGPASVGPKHSHAEYQFCLSLDFPGEYRYRGYRHAVPVGSLSVIHPGETHSSRDPHDRRTEASYRLVYVRPGLLADAATEVGGRGEDPPFFPSPVVLDRDLARRFLGLHVATEGAVSRLEEDARLLDVLSGFVARYAERGGRSRPAGKEHRAVGLVRDYLEDNFAENVALADLSRLAGLSPYHLARVFAEEVGLPPHRYQVMVRLNRAKDLLLRGWPVARVAHSTGFSDQSHLTRHFKRLVGVPPGRYPTKNSKNVQDFQARTTQ